MGKPILVLDFDGVCSNYSSGWQGIDNIPDPPVEGLFEFLYKAREHFDIQIYSSRSHQEGGIEAMMEWFIVHSPISCFTYSPNNTLNFWKQSSVDGSRTDLILSLGFPTEKPPAMVTLDDRALTFTGVWPDIDSLRNFKPWNKQ